MSSKKSTTTTRTPYDPALVTAGSNALTGGYGAAQQTLAQNSPALQNAINSITANMAKPPGYLTDARTQLDKTIQGDYVNSNPYTGGIADLIAKKTAGNYNASFGASGRSHGGLAALLSGQGIGDALGQFYSGVYDQERGRQQQAIGEAPAFHGDEYTDINALFPAVNNAAMMPLNAATQYSGGITGLISPYTTDKQVEKTSGLGSILGPALMLGGALFPPAAGLGAGMGAMGGAGGLAGLLAKPITAATPIRYLG